MLRWAFWLAVLVFLLPTDPQQQARLHATAAAALERVYTFCDRNAKTCIVGAEVWTNFVRKAEFALRLVGDLIGGRPAPGAVPREGRRSGKTDRGSVPPSDLYPPPWRGPAPRAEG